MLHHDVLRNVLHFLDRNNLDMCCYVTRLWKVLINADSAKTLAVRSVEVAQIKYSHRSPRVEFNIALEPIEGAPNVDYRSDGRR
ncbi:hypothetical protein AAVH_10892 [Aphelenchoides avenae]|nr:hypothetical protein AAVH_10892 [Aphelenchus avenae]